LLTLLQHFGEIKPCVVPGGRSSANAALLVTRLSAKSLGLSQSDARQDSRQKKQAGWHSTGLLFSLLQPETPGA